MNPWQKQLLVGPDRVPLCDYRVTNPEVARDFGGQRPPGFYGVPLAPRKVSIEEFEADMRAAGVRPKGEND